MNPRNPMDASYARVCIWTSMLVLYTSQATVWTYMFRGLCPVGLGT